MVRGKVEKVTPKSGKTALATPKVRVGKRAALTPEERARLVEQATRLAIELHRDALKELERY